jgi:cytochrome c biogenesis protein CcmG, thiol:disulfide interchange protein DsbE
VATSPSEPGRNGLERPGAAPAAGLVSTPAEPPAIAASTGVVAAVPFPGAEPPVVGALPDAEPSTAAPTPSAETTSASGEPRGIPPWRRVSPATWAVALALSAVWAAWLVWARLTTGSSGAGWGPLDSVLRASAAAQVGKPAPSFTLPDPNGVTYTLDDLRGQVVLVNFWATWCEPCRAEMPELDQLARDYRESGFRVLAVNVLEDGPSIREFGDELDLDLPLLADRRGEAYKAYNVQALPSSYLIDGNGVIRDVRLGVVTRRYLDARLPALLKDLTPLAPLPSEGMGLGG